MSKAKTKSETAPLEIREDEKSGTITEPEEIETGDRFVLDPFLQAFSGISLSAKQSLAHCGLGTPESLAMATQAMLEEVPGIGPKKAIELILEARKIVPIGLLSATALKKREAERKRLSTQVNALNELFGGGIETGSVTEFYGQFRTGKTQICNQLAVVAQLPVDKGGLAGRVVYIDTEGTFRVDRVEAISKRFELNPDIVLSNITYGRAYSSEQQMAMVDQVFQEMRHRPFVLLIIDSLMAHFRTEYIGRENLPRRQQALGRHLAYVIKHAEQHNIAVVITNQVQAKPDAMFAAADEAPSGGNIVSHAVTHRVHLKKGVKTERKARVVDSPNLPDSTIANFSITESGIKDVR